METPSEIKTCKQNTAKFNSPGFDLVKDALICLRDDLQMLDSEVIQPALVVPQHLVAFVVLVDHSAGDVIQLSVEVGSVICKQLMI